MCLNLLRRRRRRLSTAEYSFDFFECVPKKMMIFFYPGGPEGEMERKNGRKKKRRDILMKPAPSGGVNMEGFKRRTTMHNDEGKFDICFDGMQSCRISKIVSMHFRAVSKLAFYYYVRLLGSNLVFFAHSKCCTRLEICFTVCG